MPQDTTPYVDPATLQTLPRYYSGNLPTQGGTVQPRSQGALGNFGASALDGIIPGLGGIINYASGSGDITDLIDPTGGLGLLSGLFGGDKPSWKPYVGEDGKLYFTNPNKRNPVPVPIVPGAPIKPSKNYLNTAANTQTITDLFPYLVNAINQGSLPTALNELNISRVTSPAYAQLMTELYNTYGPQLNAIGSEIQRRNALEQAKTDRAVITGPGKDLVSSAYDLSQIFDKPYYDTRAVTAGRLGDLLNSIDLSGGLSPTERDEIAKGLAREGVQRGTLNAPSQTQTVSNAMRYGNAGYSRQQQAKSNLASAISAASGFLPTSKSGVDVFQVATGRPSQANPGNALFPGLDKSTNTSSSYGLAGSLLGGLNNADINQANINANKKDWLDKFNQFASGLSSLTSSAGSIAGMAGMCWIAREVYGIDNPKWKQFRYWLLAKAPVWLFNLYAKYGEKIAKFISNKSLIKNFIRKMMDYAITSKTNFNN